MNIIIKSKMALHWTQKVVLLANLRLIKLFNTIFMCKMLFASELFNASFQIHSTDNALLPRFLNNSMDRMNSIIVNSLKGIQFF